MFMRTVTAAAIAACVATAAAHAANHREAPPIRPDPGRLETALKRFESDVARSSGRGAASSLSDGAIIIVGGKTGIPPRRTAPHGPSPADAVGPPCRPRPRDGHIPLRPHGATPPDDSMPRQKSLPRSSAGDKGIVIVNNRPSSLAALSAEIRRFEKGFVPPNPCVTACRAQAKQCMTRCRNTLRTRRLEGQCSCEPAHARCLVQSARLGKCRQSAPSPGLRQRR